MIACWVDAASAARYKDTNNVRFNALFYDRARPDWSGIPIRGFRIYKNRIVVPQYVSAAARGGWRSFPPTRVISLPMDWADALIDAVGVLQPRFPDAWPLADRETLRSELAYPKADIFTDFPSLAEAQGLTKPKTSDTVEEPKIQGYRYSKERRKALSSDFEK